MKSKREQLFLHWLTATSARHLKTILVMTVVGLVTLLGCGFAVALMWPDHWPDMIASLMLGILGSAISVLLAVPVAIFIVEGYLERRRREAEEKAAAEEEAYKMHWNAYALGGISMLSAIITHISLYVAYGRERYMELTEEKSPDVPRSLSEFIPSLLDAMKAVRDEKKKAGGRDSGWGPKEAARLSRAFEEVSPSPDPFTLQDLDALLHSLHVHYALVREQMFLFQPFMSRHMGVAVALVEVARHLRSATEEVQHIIASNMLGREPVATLDIGHNLASTYCRLGSSSVKLIQMIWAGPKDLDQVLQKQHSNN